MAYQLNSTAQSGWIAAHAVGCLMCDPDTGTPTEYGTDGGVISIGASVTTGTLGSTWNGHTVKYWKPADASGAGSAYIAYSSNKPSVDMTGSESGCTVLVLCEMAGNYQEGMAGNAGNWYFNSRGSGDDCPNGSFFSITKTGTGSNWSSGDKVMFGFTFKKGTGGQTKAVRMLHNSGSATYDTLSEWASSSTWSCDDTSKNSYFTSAKVIACLMFDAEASDTVLMAIANDPVGTMLEEAGGSSAGAARHYYSQL